MKRTLRITPLSVLLLGLALSLMALAPALLPYGGRFVTRGDFIEQQLPFILEARRILRQGASYSFSTFLGAPSVGSYAFYTLGSPFVWPLALLPRDLIPFGIAFMALAKHALCMLTSFLYLRRMTGSCEKGLLGALMYTFSSFTIVNTQFYHFTEVIAVFPLILWALECFMTRPRPVPCMLALSCGLSTLINYYFMLGTALLVALYALFRLPDWLRDQPPGRLVLGVLECAFGCALAGFLLLPALRFMMTITRNGQTDTPVWQQLFPAATLAERLRVLLMPIESGAVHGFIGDAPSWSSTACALPLFGFAGSLVFLLHPGTQGRWLRRMILTLLGFSCFPLSSGAFVLWSSLTYTRWWYGLALMLSLATVQAVDIREEHLLCPDPLWKRSFQVCTLTALLLSLPAFLPAQWLQGAGEAGRILLNRRQEHWAPDIFRFLGMGLFLLSSLALLTVLRRSLRTLHALALVCAMAVLNYAGYIAVGDAALRSGGDTPIEGPYSLEEIARPTLSSLSLPEPEGFTRIDYGRRLRNYGLLTGRSSLTAFQSLRSSIVGRFISSAGFGYNESTTVFPKTLSASLRSALSVDRYIRTDPADPVPEGFVPDGEENGFPAYANENAVPMGYLVHFITGDHDQNMDGDHIGAVMLCAATLSDADLRELEGQLPRLDPASIPDWRESAARARENACSRFSAGPDGFSADILAREQGIVVFTLPNDPGMRATLDGSPVRILTCDLSFVGIPVTPGQHRIEVTYVTRGWTAGLVLSLVSACILGLYALNRRRFFP